jgi:glycosyltransferase involved in cell wall biosynthesis
MSRVAVTSASTRVTVVTAVHNGQAFLGAAIESILNQTLADFEYILVDDASTDGSPGILHHYADRDARIVVLRNAINLNPAGALNRAFQCARADYVANLDQDDLAFPERLARQVEYLDANPEVGVVGAQAQLIDADGRVTRLIGYGTTPALARWQVFFQAPVLHSAATMRRSLVLQAGGYPVERGYASDYVLFAGLLGRTRIVSLPEVLAAYRSHGMQTTHAFPRSQLGQVLLLVHTMLAERLGLRVGLDDIGLVMHAVRGDRLADGVALLRAADLLGEIHTRYVQVEQPDAAAREQVDLDCALRWLAMAYAHRRIERAASREILRRLEAFDPRIWQRPQARTCLRGMYRARQIEAKWRQALANRSVV